MTLYRIRDGTKSHAIIPENAQAVIGKCGMDVIGFKMETGEFLAIADLQWAIEPSAPPSHLISEIRDLATV